VNMRFVTGHKKHIEHLCKTILHFELHFVTNIILMQAGLNDGFNILLTFLVP